jgi:hypothetical protein
MKRDADGECVSRGDAAPKLGAHTLSDVESTYSSAVLKFTNCRILRDGKLIKEDLWVQDGIIIDEKKRFWNAETAAEHDADETIDCMNAIIAPGRQDPCLAVPDEGWGCTE